MSNVTSNNTCNSILKSFFFLLILFIVFITFVFVFLSMETKVTMTQLGFNRVAFSNVYVSEDKFIELSRYSENDKLYEDIIFEYALREKSSDILYRPYKYIVDDSSVKSTFWDLGKRYYYGNNPQNITYGFWFDGDYENGFIRKKYQLPEANNNKVISIVICDYIDNYEKNSRSLPRYNLSEAIEISDPEIVKRAVKQYISGDGDYSWLENSFDSNKQQFFSVLFKFENETIYQCVGRIKIDINPSIENTIVKSAWEEICKSGDEKNYRYTNYEITVGDEEYLIKFFRNDSGYSQYFGLWYHKTTLKLIDKFGV